LGRFHRTQQKHTYLVMFHTILEHFQRSLNKSALVCVRDDLSWWSVTCFSTYRLHWVKLPEKQVIIQNSQFQENSLTIVLKRKYKRWKSVNCRFFYDPCVISRVSLGDSRLVWTPYARKRPHCLPPSFLLCEFYNVRMSQAAEGMYFEIIVF
jgi:hypothetical protein